MCNKVYYMCCSSCGYEDFEVMVAYMGRTANGDWYYCPECNKEISNVITHDPELEK